MHVRTIGMLLLVASTLPGCATAVAPGFHDPYDGRLHLGRRRR
jgi:hypothetical protein